MIHTIILIVLIYAALRALLRQIFGRKPPAMVLVQSPNHAAIVAGARAAAEAAHYARLNRPCPFSPRPETRAELIERARYKLDRARRAWHAGYGSYEAKNVAAAELRALQGDILDIYSPRDGT